MAVRRNIFLKRHSRKKRLAAAALLALALAPGTFVRTAIPLQHRQTISITEVADLPATVRKAGFVREGVWQLTSPNIDFGGYSALLAMGGSDLRLQAFSDRGTMVTFPAPDTSYHGTASFARVSNRGWLSNTVPDIESAARDRVTGDYWLAFENGNAVIRYSSAGELEALHQPAQWRDWPENSGAEAMERLPDGRFLVLPESSSTGLLHPADPTGGAPAMRLDVTLPGDYAATDLAALPDGRVLVLLRRTTFAYPPFTAALGIADPRALEDGGELTVELLANLDTILPRENYEGLAVVEQVDGSLALWIIADDNLASFQRALLAKLLWTPPAPRPSVHEKAREERPRAPSNP